MCDRHRHLQAGKIRALGTMDIFAQRQRRRWRCSKVFSSALQEENAAPSSWTCSMPEALATASFPTCCPKMQSMRARATKRARGRLDEP